MWKDKMTDKENSLDSLDEKTCDQVMQDLHMCIEDWSRQDLDTKAAVLTLLKFTVDISFQFSESPFEAMHLISSVITDNIDQYESDELAFILRQTTSEKKIIH